MKQILVIGAGLVARPLVRYLLAQEDIEVVLADQLQSKADALIEGHPSGRAIAMDVQDTAQLNDTVSRADLVVSLLPWNFHPKIAGLCLEHKKHLVTASYVKEEMQALDAAAREKGLIFLNEVGVDPGIDHMAAMKTIDEIKAAGGEVTTFHSYCGGLPAMANNNNPLGYKFSWSPEGALLAAGNDGRYLANGKVMDVPGCKLFEHYWLTDIPGSGVFEAYVNRDSLPYLKLYDIPTAQNIYRGTLRNVGYCETWGFLKKLGFMNRKMKFDMQETSPNQVVSNMIHSNGNDVKGDVAAYLKIPRHSLTLKKLEWLGMFSNDYLALGTVSVFDMFAHILKEKLTYNDGEVDLLLQHHEFVAKYPDGKEEMTMSTLMDTGTPGGDSSMSKTVGLPAAISARLIAEEKIDLKGVCIPVHSQIYKPVLAELAALNIKFVERKTIL